MNSSDIITELEVRTAWALARIGELVQRGRTDGWLLGQPLPQTVDSERILREAERVGVGTPMEVLRERLSLTSDELDVLWLLACIELEPQVSRAAELLLSPGMNEQCVQMVERLVTRDQRRDEDLFERLAGLALIETSSDPRVPLHRRAIRVNDRVLDLARGRLGLDRALGDVAVLEPVLRADAASDLDPELRSPNGCAVYVATGVEGSGRATRLRRAIAAHGHAVLSIRTAMLAHDETTLVRQLRSIVRECRLHDAWPLLLHAETLGERRALCARELLSAKELPVFATAREAFAWHGERSVISVAIPLPDATQREALWREVLPGTTDEVITTSAQRYTISPGMIRQGAQVARLVAGDVAVEASHVHAGLRAQLDRRLAEIARRIDTRQTWDDLVIPADQFNLLVELVARVRHRRFVLDTWGFADKVGRGLGLSALFSGPPGTGKTMIAGLLARELGLDLYQVDLSKVVSKYIGETEKQLANLFEAAESGHAILLFDEADSLFAKRTEVKSSNDRYANLEVNYLLQRIEAFSGITILTTNHETAIDPAFLRRLAFHVRVPMPDEQHREDLWRAMLPARAAREDGLDFAGLATKFAMTGGYIRNAVLRAAFLCAEEGTPISNAHLWHAARAEYEAMGKIVYTAGK